MKRYRRHSKREVVTPAMNLTPLIDVIFVVLIAFILIAPLVQMNRVELAAGNAQSLRTLSPLEESQAIHIYVERDNRIRFDSQTISFTTLRSLLSEVRKRKPESKLLLFHDEQAHFGVYQSIRNMAEEIGFSHMEVVLSPEKDQYPSSL